MVRTHHGGECSGTKCSCIRKRGRDKELGSQGHLQGHACSDLTSSHYTPFLHISTPSQRQGEDQAFEIFAFGGHPNPNNVTQAIKENT